MCSRNPLVTLCVSDRSRCGTVLLLSRRFCTERDLEKEFFDTREISHGDLAKGSVVKSLRRNLARRPLLEILYRDLGHRSLAEILFPHRDIAEKLLEILCAVAISCRDLVWRSRVETFVQISCAEISYRELARDLAQRFPTAVLAREPL